ncbi:MAG TPA: hypothetical protein VEM41_01495, partial [Actinomycetota bacterium]|nr:hypothetical protein [Actinomycetota bacterium]
MSSVVETRPAGWRPDPSGRYEWRYWDNGWTNRVANSATTTQAATARPEPRAIDAAPVGDPTPTVSLRGGFVSSAASPGGYSTAPPPSASEQAVLDAVRAGRPPVKPRSAQASPRPGELPPAPGARAPRSRLWAAIVAWFRSLAEEPESYHSPKAGIDLPPHPNSNTILASSPANYGRAGLVALAACGLGVGAYLPWLSGTVDTVPFERTGLELGKAWGFTWL